MNRSPTPRRSRNAWISAALALLVCGGLSAQPAERTAPASSADLPPLYRVDVIVFRHVDGESDRIRAGAPVDFSALGDPLLVAAANRYVAAARAAMVEALPFVFEPSEPAGAEPYLASSTTRIQPIPPAYAALGELSAPMQRALERLIDSPDHELLLTRSWIQSAGPRHSTPELRLHDQAVVATRPAQRPIAPPWIPIDLRVPVAVDDDGELRFRRLFRPRPPRLQLFRLDGGVRFRQRQFLHIDLDLVWQERDRPLAGPGTVPPGPMRAGEKSDAPAPEWDIHRMQQSRVVSPERLEYFDSALFGVLAGIQRFEQVVPEPEPEPDTAPAGPDASAPAATPGRP